MQNVIFSPVITSITCRLNNALSYFQQLIPYDMLDRVMRNIRIRLQQCIDNNGHHLQDIIFKTMWFKTPHVVVSESKNKIFISRIVFLLFTLKFREVILPHPVKRTVGTSRLHDFTQKFSNVNKEKRAQSNGKRWRKSSCEFSVISLN